VARKLAREASHTLRELGDQALVPAELPTAAAERSAIVRAWVPESLLWCGWLPAAPAATLVMDGLHRTSGRARPCGNPITIMSPDLVRAPR
jgi:hypothetical protein